MAWDAPEAYGVARKRVDARDPSTHSAFNSKRTMPEALAPAVAAVDCELLVLSYNDESWLAVDELEAMCAGADRSGRRRHVATLAFDSARYVGARIGIHDPSGRKVGRVAPVEPGVARHSRCGGDGAPRGRRRGGGGRAPGSGATPVGARAVAADRLRQAT